MNRTDQFLNIHGVVVRVTGNDPNMFEQVLEELRCFLCAPDLPPKVFASFISKNDVHVRESELSLRHRNPGDEMHWIREDICSVINIPNRTVTVYLTPACPPDAVAVILFGTIGFLVRLELALEAEVTAFHAASLHKNGQGILLLGRTNSGKTSLSCLMTGHGFTYLSEEDSFIRKNTDGSFEILPYPRRIRISGSVMEQHPEFAQLAHEAECVESLDGKVFRMDPRQTLPDGAPLTKVVLLDNDSSNLELAAEPMDQAQALFTLLSSLEVAKLHESPKTAWEELRIHNRSAFSITKSVVDTFGVKRLKYSINRDFSDLPDVISSILEAV